MPRGFSKKFENHCHALSLYFMYYNFCRIYKSLKVSPTMASGVSKTLWNMEQIVALIHARAKQKAPLL